MKKNRTNIIFIISILITLITIFLFIFFLRIIKNKNQHISAASVILAEKILEKEKSTLISEKMAEIKSTKDSINSYFVDPDKIDIFVSYLEKLGVELGSSISVNGVNVPVKTKNIISFEIAVTGTFKSIINTIALLENIPYQIDITQVYLNKRAINNRTKTSSWQADISFNILSLN